MLIRVDKEACQGHARCHAMAPDVYPIDDNGFCAITTLEVTSDADKRQALDGAASCPERAITVS
jgi:ferredoxin